ncbi:MAG: nucleotidyltransferase [Lachnospiraceae bacterium]|nr:nucleotidyltransferase [Lachnospiraceae bacterium]
MKITGIVAEYNPFHYGHQYHLQQAKEHTGADFCIVVMSGNFMQRGVPAIIDKYSRTRMALSHGADLVLELPCCYATGSAEFFALGAVSLLDRLGCVDSLCFGSETGHLPLLSRIAHLLLEEPAIYRQILQDSLKEGCTFPQARSRALEACLPDIPEVKEVLSSPNNILGIEYLKALAKRHSSIHPYTIERTGSGYHASHLPAAENDFASASAIRNALTDGMELESAASIKEGFFMPATIQRYVPPSVYQILENAWQQQFPICSKDFSLLLQYRLLLEASQDYTAYQDITPALDRRIRKYLNQFQNFEQFAALLKSKDLTYSRVCRGLLHLLLDMTDDELAAFCTEDYVFYGRLLGFRHQSKGLFHQIKQHTSIPLLSKMAKASHSLTETGMTMLEQDVRAAHIYESVVSSQYSRPFFHEYSRQLVILS